MSYVMEKGGKEPAGGATGARKASRTAGARKEDWVGRQLRRVYDDALSEPIPEELMDLLKKIDDDAKDDPKQT